MGSAEPLDFEKRVPEPLNFVKQTLEITCLRNTMSQNRLNHVMLMNIHKEETKIMSLAGVANEFAAKNDRRREDFGINKFM